MNIETLNALEMAIKNENLLEKYHLEKIGIFGSFARGEKANDIDFYIDSENYNIKNLVGLKNDLEKITEKEVDIMLKKYANPIILSCGKGYEICYPMKNKMVKQCLALRAALSDKRYFYVCTLLSISGLSAA